MALPFDDVCLAGDAACALSLQQLRGERLRENATMDTAAAGAIKASSTGRACVDQNGWDTDFAQHAYQCGFQTMGNAYRSGRCMAKKQHISVECGACIGD